MRSRPERVTKADKSARLSTRHPAALVTHICREVKARSRVGWILEINAQTCRFDRAGAVFVELPAASASARARCDAGGRRVSVAEGVAP